MPRLIDDIRAKHRLAMPWCVEQSKVGAWKRHAEALSKFLDGDLPVIKIDNVAEYYYSGTDQEYWDLREHFPNLAPPFELAWYEFRMPKKICSKECGVTAIEEVMPHGRVGVLMFGSDRANVKGQDIPENMRWAVTCEIFIDYGHSGGGINGPHGTIFLAIDAEGRLIQTPFMQSFAGPEHAEMMKSLINWTFPVLLAVSFMHCRNVKILDEPVIKPLAKKYHARTGRWPVRYKTIEITPLKEILRREGRSESVGLQQALHICRGHFRDYRQGKGLFGKFHQLVWMPQTVRGTKHEEKKRPVPEYEVKL
jgi:hypothetical protein